VCVSVCVQLGVVLRVFPYVIDPRGRSSTWDWHTWAGISHGIDPYGIVVTHGIDQHDIVVIHGIDPHGLLIPHGINLPHGPTNRLWRPKQQPTRPNTPRFSRITIL